MALAGGVNALLAPGAFLCFYNWGMMAADGRCKTFDAAADGFVRSEGCGLVVLKRLSDAMADGDRILALIRGSAVNQDGRSSGLTVPNGLAQEAVIRQALANARVEPREISYVEAHGTGTSLGDPIEAHALAAVFGPGRAPDNPLTVGSVKTNIGHPESAAGVAGLIKVVLSLQNGHIPAHLHFTEMSPRIDWNGVPVRIPTKAQAWPAADRKRLAGVSSFGFSGTNAHAVLEEAPAFERRSPERDRPLHLLALSARSEAALMELAARYRQHLQRGGDSLPDLCFTANAGRNHFEYRTAILAASIEDLRGKLAQPLSANRIQQREGLKPVFLFTDQGAESGGMGRELFETQPVFHSALERADETLRPLLNISLLDVLYGSTSGKLSEKACAEPALFALEYALSELWRSWGIVPAAVVGHGVGEYAALCGAGFCSLADGLRLVAERARRMQQTDSAPEDIAASAAALRWQTPRVSLISSFTGESVSPDQLRRPEYWRRQTNQPVRFQAAIETLARQGHSVFVEIGPRNGWRQMLDSLVQLYTRGAEVDWAGFDAPYGRRRVALPTYPFERQRYWIDFQTNSSMVRRAGHPLLGTRFEIAGTTVTHAWQTEISTQSLPYLADHCVQGGIIVPATAYIEMAGAAVREVFGDGPVNVNELQFQKPLFLRPETIREVQVTLSPAGNEQGGTVHVYSRQRGSDDAWTLHVSGKALRIQAASDTTSLHRFEAFLAQKPRQLSGAEFYRYSEQQGNNWGAAFQGMEQAWLTEEEGWARIAIPASIQPEIERYGLHPALADACGHALAAIAAFGRAGAAQKGAFVGEALGSLSVYCRPRGTRLLVHARIQPDSEPNVCLGEVQAFDEDGTLVSTVTGARLRYLEVAAEEAVPSAEDWVYGLDWEELPFHPPEAPPDCTWLIFADRSGVAQALAARIRVEGLRCEIAESEGDFAIPAASGTELRIVYLRSLEAPAGVLPFLQALAARQPANTRVWLVTQGAQATGRETLPTAVWQAPVWGLGRTFSVEQPQMWGGLVDLDPAAADAEILWRHLAAPEGEDQVALRGNQRLVCRLERRPLPAAGPAELRADGAYLITGGLSGLGLEIARWMVGHGARRLILMGRTPLPPRARWKDFTGPQAPAIAVIRELEQLGATVHTAAIDVADEAALYAYLKNYERECWPPVRGVVHAAGVLRHHSLEEMTREEYEALLRPKMAAWTLDRLLEEAPLDFFVLFSSASAILSSPKLGGYAAANCSLDALAHARNASGKPALSIDWGVWTQAGMATRFAASEIQMLGERGMGGIPTREGLDLFGRLLGGAKGQAAVLPIDWAKWTARYPAYTAAPLLRRLLGRQPRTGANPAALDPRRLLAAPEEQRAQRLAAYVSAALGAILGFGEHTIDPTLPIHQLGMDSLMALELKNRIDADLGVSLPLVQILQGPSVDELAAQLLEQLAQTTERPQAGEAELLAKLDLLSEAEVDAALASLLSETATE